MRWIKKFNESFGKKLIEDVKFDSDIQLWRNSDDIAKKFNNDFINTIGQFCLQLDDLGYDIEIRIAKYLKSVRTGGPIPCANINIDNHHGQNTIDWSQLEITIREIDSYAKDFDLRVDIGIPGDDFYNTVGDFFESYNVDSEISSVQIIIF